MQKMNQVKKSDGDQSKESDEKSSGKEDRNTYLVKMARGTENISN